MVFRTLRPRRPGRTIPKMKMPEIELPEIEVPEIEREDVTRFLRRAAVYAVPAFVTFAVFTLIAWAIRRQFTLPDEITLEEVVAPVEPAYEVSA
jgi:hypothetical protein